MQKILLTSILVLCFACCFAVEAGEKDYVDEVLRLIRTGNTTKAEKILVDMLAKKDCKEYIIYYLLAATYSRAGEYEQAIETYRTYFTLDPSSFDKYECTARYKYILRNYEGSEKDATLALLFTKRFHLPYMIRGQARMRLGKYNSALEDIERYLSEFPDDTSAILLRGRLKAKLNDLEGALIDFNTLISNDTSKKDRRPYLCRAILYIQQGDYKRAEKDSRKADSIISADPILFINIGIAYFDKGKYDKALEYLNKAKEFLKKYNDTNDKVMWLGTTTIYSCLALLGLGKRAQANSITEKSIKEYAEKPFLKASLLFLSGKISEKKYIAIAKSDRQNCAAQFVIGFVNHAGGNDDICKKQFLDSMRYGIKDMYEYSSTKRLLKRKYNIEAEKSTDNERMKKGKQIIDAFEATKENNRNDFIKKLSTFERRCVKEYLQPRLESSNREIACKAAIRLGCLGEEIAIPYLLYILYEYPFKADGRKVVNEHCDNIYGLLKTLDNQIAIHLVGMYLKNQFNSKVKKYLLQIKMKTLPYLLKAIETELDKGNAISGFVIEFLGEIKYKKALPVVLRVHERKISGTTDTLYAIGMLGDESCLDKIMKCLESDDGNVVKSAMKALRNITGLEFDEDAEKWKQWYEHRKE